MNFDRARQITWMLAAASLWTGVASAQPRVNSVLNNYSFTLPGLPNYGIAQGSLFVVFGAGVGPSITPTLPDLSKTSLTTNLNGVTVSITVSGTTVQAPLYYVSATQVAGILPSNTPVGTGTITVSYNGQTSSTAPITVVPAAFGLLTLSGNGTGPAAVFNASNRNGYVTPGTAANPGDTLVLWGSGLGASPGDETKYPFLQTDLKANVRVYIGGVQAQIAYAGRSQFPGLDQINVVVPQGVSGCSVGILVQTGNYVSNAATIAVAPAGGRTCSDPVTSGLSSSELEGLLNKGTVRTGFIGLSKSTTQTPPISVGGITVGGSTNTSDSASALFSQYTAAQFTTSAAFQTTSLGSCNTFVFQGAAGSTPQVTTPVVLDAGTITMRKPDGSSVTLTKVQGGFYSVSGSDAQGSPSPLFIPNTGGQFSFTNTGGEVGVFSGAQINMPPALNWTNMASINTVSRAQGVTVNWDRSTPYSGFVTISGTSFSLSGSNTSNVTITGFTCTAPYSDGTFTVPSYVLLSLISGSGNVGGIAIPTGSLSLSLNAAPVRINAPNVDYAAVSATTSTGKSVTYQ
ncbi:MAG TPA: hypothetical protein VMZ52_02580 [Bryobacteraceae bacterium]|nr:hypothetical protein [Bryobacteraceae bacterium]